MAIPLLVKPKQNKKSNSTLEKQEEIWAESYFTVACGTVTWDNLASTFCFVHCNSAVHPRVLLISQVPRDTIFFAGLNTTRAHEFKYACCKENISSGQMKERV